MKEEVANFIIIRDHQGNIWLLELVSITPQLITVVTSFLAMGDPLLLTNRNPTLLQEITCTHACESSKGIKINQTNNETTKWVAIIIFIYLMNSSHLFDVKMEMIEACSFHKKV